MKIAALQMVSTPDVARNLDAAAELIDEAARGGALLVALPEYFCLLGRRDTDKLAVAEDDGTGPIQQMLAASARRARVWVVGGTLPMRTADPQRVRNSCCAYAPDGSRVARYDKIHLFDVDLPGGREGYRESANAKPGAEPVLVDTPAGRLGLTVCYDLRFPELFRQLVSEGAEIFSVPSAFTSPTGRAHWETLLRARAIENLCFVIAAAQSGVHDSNRETYGDTLIVDHWGRVLARQPRGSGVVTAALDKAGQQETRETFPALKHRVLA